MIGDIFMRKQFGLSRIQIENLLYREIRRARPLYRQQQALHKYENILNSDFSADKLERIHLLQQ